MKKILCLIDTVGMGGAERQMMGLTLLLKNKGYKVDLATYHSHDFNEHMSHYGITSTTITSRKTKLSKLLAVRKYIRRNGGYDWVIAYKDGPCLICCILKMLAGKFKLIVSERSTTQTINRYERLKFFLYRFADVIVPNSFSQACFIKEHFSMLDSKINVITNFTDTVMFSPKDNYHISRLTRNVVTVARVTKAKNIISYLDAISILLSKKGMKNVHFDWYGDLQHGEENLAEEIREKMGILHLSGYVTFHPGTTEIVQHYQNADIFCLPSSYEGFPNVICEAMSCAKPIVCSRVCDNPTIVREGENGLLFDPHNVNDIAEKLHIMLSKNQKELRTWGQRSRQIALEMFSKDAFVQKYINLIGD